MRIRESDTLSSEKINGWRRFTRITVGRQMIRPNGIHDNENDVLTHDPTCPELRARRARMLIRVYIRSRPLGQHSPRRISPASLHMA